MLISFVVPAYNAALTVERTLKSVYASALPEAWSVEVVVVDDGSSDGKALASIIAGFPDVSLLRHAANRGMCAGRNTGIAASRGDIVVVLDADDELVPDWPGVFGTILREWPAECFVCYAACRNETGRITSNTPGYSGMFTLNDLLNERHSGEYIPMFRGDYVRDKGYVDLGMRKSCGIVSYIRFAMDAPFWVSSRILRIYHESNVVSVTADWTSPRKASETAACYKSLFERFGDLYRREAPVVWRTKLLRYAVYLRLAGMPGAWRTWYAGIAADCWKESLGAALIILMGPKLGGGLASVTKKVGLVRRYG